MKISDFKWFVINLDRRADRMEEFRQRFEPLGLPEIERFAGVDGSAEEIPPEWGTRHAGGWGCLQSHWRLLRQVYDAGIEFVMILEDDAEPLLPPDRFAGELQKTLDELPAGWEMFYPGCEHLRTKIKLPARVSERLVVPYNANRTHAYALTRAGMEKALAKCEAWKEWDRWWHIDWAFGDLHEKREIRVFCAYPPLFGQAAGVSDINPEINVRAMHFVPSRMADYRASGVIVTSEQVGFGEFSPELPPPFDREIYDGFFAHAPSEVTAELTEPVEIFAAHGTKEGAWEPAEAVIDGTLLGHIKDRGDTTDSIVIREPGEHRLEFRTDDNRAAHTYWVTRPLSRLPFKEGAVFEVFSNARCPRNCPHCNQLQTMKSDPDREYTAADAEALVEVLPFSISLIFSGGEPSKLGPGKWAEILGILRDSGKVGRISVTTSDDSEKWIRFASEQFDHIYLSHRSSMKWAKENRPEYLCDPEIEVWGSEVHSVWPAERFEGQTRCCCSDVGVHAAIFGTEVFPCILARELGIRRPELATRSIPLADYFAGKRSFPPIGLYEACRWCVNNSFYRGKAATVPTG